MLMLATLLTREVNGYIIYLYRNRRPHHIVTYLQNMYFEKKTGFEYFRNFFHLLCLIEICLVTKLLLKIWSIYQTLHSIH